MKKDKPRERIILQWPVGGIYVAEWQVNGLHNRWITLGSVKGLSVNDAIGKIMDIYSRKHKDK